MGGGGAWRRGVTDTTAPGEQVSTGTGHDAHSPVRHLVHPAIAAVHALLAAVWVQPAQGGKDAGRHGRHLAHQQRYTIRVPVPVPTASRPCGATPAGTAPLPRPRQAAAHFRAEHVRSMVPRWVTAALAGPGRGGGGCTSCACSPGPPGQAPKQAPTTCTGAARRLRQVHAVAQACSTLAPVVGEGVGVQGDGLWWSLLHILTQIHPTGRHKTLR